MLCATKVAPPLLLLHPHKYEDWNSRSFIASMDCNIESLPIEIVGLNLVGNYFQQISNPLQKLMFGADS